MSVSETAFKIEKAIGHDDNAITNQDVSHFEHTNDVDLMDALVWAGKNQVEMGMPSQDLTTDQAPIR